MQHICRHCQWVAGCIIEHWVSAALYCLRNVRGQVIEPVCQVGIRQESRPASIKAHTALQHNHQLIRDPSTIVM